jgi:multiple sugar transport system ATP-binding protein
VAEICFENVGKSFGSKVALNGIDLTIGDGEFFSLLGPSGCGKSTLLSLACGLEQVTHGKIFIGGKDVTHVPPRDRGIAMVFQDYALYPHITVYENLALPLKAIKESKAQIDRKIQEVSDVLDIKALLHNFPRHLSGGQRQRVALGRALVRNPQVFLMDEPLSNLDARLRIQMRTELRLLKERLAATIIYVTHDQAEAMTLSDRMAVMNGGKLQQVGAPIELYNRPTNKFVASFLGDIGINLMNGIVKDHGTLSVDIEGNGTSLALDTPSYDFLRDRPAGEEVSLGVRPEHVQLHTAAEPGAMKGEVILCEQLGSEQHIHVRVGYNVLVAREAPTARFALQQAVFMTFAPDAIRLFNGKTGMALDANTGSI